MINIHRTSFAHCGVLIFSIKAIKVIIMIITIIAGRDEAKREREYIARSETKTAPLNAFCTIKCMT